MAATETEESVSTEAHSAAREYGEYIKAANYNFTERPSGRVQKWQDRCTDLAARVTYAAEQIHARHRVVMNFGNGNGVPLFLYLEKERGSDGQRLVGGIFTVPWLATDDELLAIIRQHRPNDYATERAEAESVTWVPGGEP